MPIILYIFICVCVPFCSVYNFVFMLKEWWLLKYGHIFICALFSLIKPQICSYLWTKHYCRPVKFRLLGSQLLVSYLAILIEVVGRVSIYWIPLTIDPLMLPLLNNMSHSTVDQMNERKRREGRQVIIYVGLNLIFCFFTTVSIVR